MKKVLEDALSADGEVTNVLKWIKKKDDPEQMLEDIRLKVSPGDRYENCAQWFLDEDKFRGWSKGFRVLDKEYDYKQALWISGGYGTGKTTIMFVTPVSDNFFLNRMQVSRSFYIAGPSQDPFPRQRLADYTLFL